MLQTMQPNNINNSYSTIDIPTKGNNSFRTQLLARRGYLPCRIFRSVWSEYFANVKTCNAYGGPMTMCPLDKF